MTYALSGSVRRAGNRMRVSVELAETDRGAVVWASHFDGVSDDLFALQDQIATKVASTIAPQVREAELRHALRKRPESMEAYDCVLRALAQLYRLSEEDFAQARTWLERAIALDPALRGALRAARRSGTAFASIRGGLRMPRRIARRSCGSPTAALERDSFDAMALALCGHAKSILLHEFDEAIALFDRAIEASPSSAIAWIRSSATYSYIGDPREAIRRAEQGLRLSPLDLQPSIPTRASAIGHYVAGRARRGHPVGTEGQGGERAVLRQSATSSRPTWLRRAYGRGAGGRARRSWSWSRGSRSVASSTATPSGIPSAAIASRTTCGWLASPARWFRSLPRPSARHRSVPCRDRGALRVTHLRPGRSTTESMRRFFRSFASGSGPETET